MTSSKNGKLSAYQCVLQFFYSICLKCCACHEKVMTGHTKCCTCHAKSSQQTWRSDAPKCKPGPPNSSDEHVSCTAPATRNASCQILCICPTPAIVFETATKPSRFAYFWQGAQSLAPATWNGIWTSKSAPYPDIATSKSAPKLRCFVHFDLEMCFAPQQCALFRHLNFQKWSKHGVLCAFWLGNVLRATTACTFSTSQLPKVVRAWCVLYVLYMSNWKCASRHNGVHFFIISTSKSGPSMVCFVHFDLEMCFTPQRRAFSTSQFPKVVQHVVFLTFWLRNVLCATKACNLSSLIWPAGSAPAALASLLFDPPEPQIIRKTQCFATFLSFRAPGPSFFWDFLFFDLLSSSLLFSDSSHLSFSPVHIVGSLTFKLPSTSRYASCK